MRAIRAAIEVARRRLIVVVVKSVLLLLLLRMMMIMTMVVTLAIARRLGVGDAPLRFSSLTNLSLLSVGLVLLMLMLMLMLLLVMVRSVVRGDEQIGFGVD